MIYQQSNPTELSCVSFYVCVFAHVCVRLCMPRRLQPCCNSEIEQAYFLMTYANHRIIDFPCTAAALMGNWSPHMQLFFNLPQVLSLRPHERATRHPMHLRVPSL